jgi:hypothetical protein
MLNEPEEFRAYTSPVEYKATSKGDTSFLGRFTFESLLNFEGMVRILTIIARGYMFRERMPNIEFARQALCAWCSIPDSKNATPREVWQSKSDFRELHEAFPELVDKDGGGWFHRHVHHVAEFVLQNPDSVRKGYAEQAKVIQDKFDKMWRDKVVQFQVGIFTLTTKGAWTLRLDDILADALVQGPLQNYNIPLSEGLERKISEQVDKKTAPYVFDLIRYYLAHKQEDTEWVVLPVTSFDMYYGGSYFSKRILNTIPETILIRQNHGPVCRYCVLL